MFQLEDWFHFILWQDFWSLGHTAAASQRRGSCHPCSSLLAWAPDRFCGAKTGQPCCHPLNVQRSWCVRSSGAGSDLGLARLWYLQSGSLSPLRRKSVTSVPVEVQSPPQICRCVGGMEVSIGGSGCPLLTWARPLTSFPPSPCRTSKPQCWPPRRETAMLSHAGSKLTWPPSRQRFLRLPTRSSTAARCIPTWQQPRPVPTCPASPTCTLMPPALLPRWAPPRPSPTCSPLRARRATPPTLPTPAPWCTRSLSAWGPACWRLPTSPPPSTNTSSLPSPILVLPEDLLFTLDTRWAPPRSTSTPTCSSQWSAVLRGAWEVGEDFRWTFAWEWLPGLCFSLIWLYVVPKYLWWVQSLTEQHALLPVWGSLIKFLKFYLLFIDAFKKFMVTFYLKSFCCANQKGCQISVSTDSSWCLF